jgi:anti-sigma factor RsiW
LVPYGDGDLAADEARQVADHLAACPACRVELRLLERSLDLARAIWQEAAREAAACQALPARSGGRWMRRVAWVTACAAVLAAAMVGLVWQRQPHSNAEPQQVAQASRVELPPPVDDVDIEEFVARQGRAARLGAAAELLGTQPGLKAYQEQADRYLAKAYGDTPAGRAAAQRLAGSN